MGGQTFYVVGGWGHDDGDVYEEMYMSEANFLVSQAKILMSEAKNLVSEAKFL